MQVTISSKVDVEVTLDFDDSIIDILDEEILKGKVEDKLEKIIEEAGILDTYLITIENELLPEGKLEFELREQDVKATIYSSDCPELEIIYDVNLA